MRSNSLQFKKAMSAVLFVLLLSVAGLTKGYAYDFSKACSTGQTLYYNIIDATNRYVEITYPGSSSNPWGEFTKPIGDIDLPTTVTNNGVTYTVKAIGERAFIQCDGLTGSLIIPNSVTTIGMSAFYDCTGFTQVYYNAINCADITPDFENEYHSPFEGCGGSLSISDDVVRIPAYMFYECSGFTGSLNIPNSVTTIGEAAFVGCSGFTDLTLGSSLTTIGHGAFYGCLGFTGSLTIPNSVTMIDGWAFSHCSGFTESLTIGNSVTTIGMYAFESCDGFTSMTLGDAVSTIGNSAFYGCSGFTSMTVRPETPPTLGSNVFQNVPMDIPVYAPCSVIDAYQSALGWSDFTNMQCNPEVTVTAVPTQGGTVSGEGTYTSGSTVTVMAIPNVGYLFMCWTSNGTEVSYNAIYSFTVTDDVVLEAMFMPSDAGDIIGEDTYNNVYFPSYSYYNYSLTQQIYTASEIGESTTITNISFFNAGAEVTRVYDIYMKHTDKTAFSSNTDWISVTSDDLVSSDTVTMKQGMWTTIELDTPFVYDGISNLVLVMDDNSGNWSNPPYMECRVFDAQGTQAIRVYSDGTNFNPMAPPSMYASGEYVNIHTMKNQIMLNRQEYDITAVSANPSAGTVIGAGQYGQGDLCRLVAITNSGYTFLNWTDDTGMVVSTDDEYAFFVTEDKSLTAHFLTGSDVCSLTFDLFDSYGDGWNGNYLVVDFGNGTSQRLTVPSGKNTTYTLPVEDGSHVELSWIKGEWMGECSFTLSYENGEVMYIGSNIDETYEYGFDMDCAGQPSTVTYVGDQGTATNYFLPGFSYYSYNLSQQIYTADEIGGVPGIINGIAFYNGGEQAKTRTYAIYLKATGKTAFASQTDWVTASEDDMVFSGSVTLAPGKWTPIIFNNPFDYDGVSNLVLIVDDNTGSYTGVPHLACRVFNTQDIQAIRVYSDDTDYDPYNPSAYDGALTNVKNQVLFDITSACVQPFDLNTTDITDYSATFNWEGYQDSYNVRYREAAHIENAVFSENFENGMSQWTFIDADGDGYNWRLATEVMDIGYGHHGSNNCVLSQSYFQNTILYPDNYLVSPQMQLGGTLAFYARAYDVNWAAEHFGMAISTTGNTNAADFTTIQEWTLTAKGEGAKTGEPRDGNRGQGNWYRYTVDLSAYAGQTGYVALRHFDCYDQFYLEVDDIAIGTPVETGSWTIVTATGNFMEIYDFNPGTEYEWQVQGVNCDGQGNNSEWSDIVAFATLPSITQTYALSQGWNWWSTNIDITLDDLKTALVVASPNAAITIKSRTQNVAYNPNNHRWTGQLNSFDVTQMYMIYVSFDCEIMLTGAPINPVGHPVTISNGSNWIAFPLGGSMSVNNVFAGFAVNGDKVKSRNGNSQYIRNHWSGGVTTLVPGQGYMYISNTQETRTFTFPASTR